MTVTEEIKQIFQLLDVDEDGQVSYEEFAAFWNQNVRQGDSASLPKLTTAMRRGSHESGSNQAPSDDDSSAFFKGLVQASTISFATACSFSASILVTQQEP